MIREKTSEKFDIDVEELETPEMKELLNEVIEEHLANISEEIIADEQEESTTGEEESEMDSGFADELVENEEPVVFLPVKREKKELKDKVPKEKKIKAEKPVKRTKKAVKAQNTLDNLKSYVFKCGVRKIWKKELEGLDEAASIAKVRGILEELGVEGRPSLEKCKKIKEQREFAEEMKIIDETKILQTRLRGQKSTSFEENNSKSVEKKIVPRLDLSAFGDSESE